MKRYKRIKAISSGERLGSRAKAKEEIKEYKKKKRREARLKAKKITKVRIRKTRVAKPVTKVTSNLECKNIAYCITCSSNSSS